VTIAPAHGTVHGPVRRGTGHVGQSEEGEKIMDTYKIIRFRRDGESETIATGLTLQQAQEHCTREDTHDVDWFDGYSVEDPADAESA
jgi:hypothetical protein